jgi:hypothetical protein
MEYIKKMIIFFCFYTGYLYSSDVSDYYLWRFHRGLPLRYLAEMFLLDNRYTRLIQNFKAVKEDEFNEIFESMECVAIRLSKYKIAQYDYQEDIIKYKNKLSELKK